MSRKEIVGEVETALIRLRQSGQKLTEAKIPNKVYESTYRFVISAPFSDRYTTGMFEFLVNRARDNKSNTHLSIATDVVIKWREGLKVLASYPTDLYLAPNRPELKIIKLATGIFEYQINRKLGNAREFLQEMGYEPYRGTRSDFILQNTSNLASIVTELIILHEELGVVLKIIEEVRNTMTSESVSGRQLLLEHILIARSKSGPSKVDSVNYLMHDLSHAFSDHTHQSLPEEQAVFSDGYLGSRKNDRGYISRSSGGYTSPVTFSSSSSDSLLPSPPPDSSMLPPPAISKDQVMKMFESSGSESSIAGSIRQVTPVKRTLSQEKNDVGRQIYRPFKEKNYTPVLFNIGDANEEVWSGDMPTDTGLSSRRNPAPMRSNSFDLVEEPRKPLRHNSSLGDILDTTSEKMYPSGHTTYPPSSPNHASFNYPPPSNYPLKSQYQDTSNFPYQPVSNYHPVPPPTYFQPVPPPSNYELPSSNYPPTTNYPPTSNYQPTSNYPHYQPTSNYHTSSQQFRPEVHSGYHRQALERQVYQEPPKPSYHSSKPNYGIYGENDVVPRNSTRRSSTTSINVVPQANNQQANYTKDLAGYRTSNMLMADSYHNTNNTWGGEDTRQYLRQRSQESIRNKPLTSSGAAAVSRPSPKSGWTCKCGHVTKDDFPQCMECTQDAPWLDISPPSLKTPNTDLPKNIETDSSLNSAPHSMTYNNKAAWECCYCLSRNVHSGNVCCECHQRN